MKVRIEFHKMSTNYITTSPPPCIINHNILSNVPWKSLGEDNEGVVPTNVEEMVERNTSLLEYWLRKVVRSRDELEFESDTQLSVALREELRNYVARIAALYHGVHFHSFEHASHVVLSANSLLHHLLGDDTVIDNDNKTKRRRNSWKQFNTYGISTRPLAQFTFVFAALIHDVQHEGISNRQLVKEGHPLAMRYNDRSILEQNSLSLSFELLMLPEFANLRCAIFATPEERHSFRSLLIDLVLSTDISCPEQTEIENSKWKLAFPSNIAGATYETYEQGRKNQLDECQKKMCRRRPSLTDRMDHHSSYPTSKISLYTEIKNTALLGGELRGCSMDYCGCITQDFFEGDELKANVLLVNMMRLCDVAHTMQDFRTFLKWNCRLYDELYSAYRSDQGDDCFSNWYKGQIAFLDTYVIPLAERLQRCCPALSEIGGELVRNAQENKNRWNDEGQAYSNVFLQDNLRKMM